jgi:hypothetical protein
VSEESGRGLTGFLSRFGGRRGADGTAESPPIDERGGEQSGPVYGTKALRKFLSMLSAREAPVLLDLGPVIGPNLNFFGESLGCKVFIEDLFTDVERHTRAGTLADLPAHFESRLTQADSSVDGILAWDLIDYLDVPAAQALATQLTRLLRVDGALLAFFNATQVRSDEPKHYTKYIVVDDNTLRHRQYPGSRARQRVFQNRDIIRLFEGLRVSDSFLLQTNIREILFRKPAYLSGQ